MEIEKKLVVEQLKNLYDFLQTSLKTRITIKGWCITIWLAVIILMLREEGIFQQVELNQYLPLMVFIPIITFWFLEATEGARTNLYKKMAMEIEKELLNEKIEIDNPSRVFLISKYECFGLKEKCLVFSKTIFTSKTIVSFYGILFLLSFIFIFTLFPGSRQIASYLFIGITIFVIIVFCYYIRKTIQEKIGWL